MTPNKRDLKAYSRFDGTGRIVPGSTVLRRNKPKNGNWKQVQAYECCDPFAPTCAEPLILEAQPAMQFYEFGFRVNDGNTVAGTIEWGDGDTETFDLSGPSGYTYFGHTYSTPDWIPYTVKVFFTSVTGIDNLEIGDGPWKTLSASNISTVFAGSSIEQVDGDGSLYTSLDVHDLPITSLYSLECPNLAFLNVQGCTNLDNTQLFTCAFETLDFSGCTSLQSADIYDNPNLTSLIIDGCDSLQYLYVDGCALSTSNVDYIIQTLDNSGVTGGSLDSSGGTNGAPSGAVAANIASLIGKGWSINTN
jgi:hypothetical protein